MIGDDLEPDQISVVETVESRSASSSNVDKEALIIMTSGAFTAALFELIPRLELLTKKDRIDIPATSVGTGDSSIPSRLKRGELVDVVIVANPCYISSSKRVWSRRKGILLLPAPLSAWLSAQELLSPTLAQSTL